MHDTQNDPRTRKSRHELTATNLASTIQFTDIPPHWTTDSFTSVIAGSGSIFNISEKKNGSGSGALVSIDVDYKDANAANRALNSINKINHFPCKMALVIPDNWEKKKAGEASVTELELNRDAYPWDDKLELPFEMVSEVPLPRKPVPSTNTPTNAPTTFESSSNTAPVVPEPQEQIQFPDILARASQHLPAYQQGSMSTPDVVSQNLSKIPTLQLIEILSNLKILANQPNKLAQLEQFLKSNIDLTVAVTQAMLEMGLINYHVISTVLSTMPSLPPPQPHQPLPAQPVQFAPVPHPLQSPPVQHIMPQAHPPQPALHVTGPLFNEAKLAALPQDQQNMIRTALSMSQGNILGLPLGQRQLIDQLKKDYLL